MSPPGMVRVRHFEFLCRSHDIEPTVERFRAFYQLIRNMGFYSFSNRGSAKKIFLKPPKSFHDWKQKFFFIREEVISIAMIFRTPDVIEKKELPIPKKADWYVKLTAIPNRIFGENVLVGAQMSDRWSEDSTKVPVLKFQDKEAHLWHVVFPTFGGSIGVRPLESGEQFWYERIKGCFLYPPAGALANHPTATEGAHIPNPRPLRAITSAGKEIFLSFQRGVCVLRDLGIDPEEKKKPKKKKVITIDVIHLSRKAGVAAQLLVPQKKKSGAAGLKSSGSVGSRNPDVGATPSSIALDEEEKEEEEKEEPAIQLISRKRNRVETTVGASVAQKTGEAPVIGKQSKAKKKTPENKGVAFKDPQELAQKRTRVVIKPFKSAGLDVEKEKKKAADKTVEKEKEQEEGPEVVHITGLDQPLHEKKKETTRGKGLEIVKPTKSVQVDPPTQTVQVISAAGGSAGAAHKEATTDASDVGAGVNVRSSPFAAGKADSGSQSSLPHPPIGPKDTLGDIYYKTYTEEARGVAPYHPP
ncbi:hypothetical protein Hanom_Chr11g01036641 [Helianthus anomalus]